MFGGSSGGGGGGGGLSTNDGTFAKESGGNLALVASNTTSEANNLVSILAKLSGTLSDDVVDRSGRALGVVGITPATAAPMAAVAASTGAVQLIAANTSRKNLSIYNSSASATLYIGSANTVSASNCITPIPPQSLYEFPSDGIYNGVIYGVWSAAIGIANVTEFS